MKPIFLAGLVLLAGCTSVETSIEVNAPASTVRAVLFDYDDYPKWNPYIVRFDGPVAAGSQVYLTVKPLGGAEISAYATITSLSENQISWEGAGQSRVASGPVTLDIPGILGAKHDFIIEERGTGKTLLLNNVRFSGVILPFYDLKPMKAGLEEMNKALKKRAEDASRTP